VGLGRVQPRAKKVQAVLDFPVPTNRRQLQQFLGMTGYYREFVPQFCPHFCTLDCVVGIL